MKKLFVILFLCVNLVVLSQNTSLEGIIYSLKDSTPLELCAIGLYSNDTLITGTTSDFDGYFVFDSLSIVNFEMKVYYFGNKQSFSIAISKNELNNLAFYTNLPILFSYCPIGPGCGNPSPKKMAVIMDDDFAQIRKIKLDDILLTKSKVSIDKNNNLSFKGARSGSEEYFIDGMRVMGEANIPTSSIYKLEVFNNGTPAKYGNTTSSVINIKTKSYYDIFYY